MAQRKIQIALEVKSRKATADFKKATKSFEKEMKDVEKAGKKTAKSLELSFSTIAKSFIAVKAFQVFKEGITESIKLASDFEEANSKFSVVFRGVERDAKAMRDTLVDSYAMSILEATRFLSTIQDTLVPMGYARNEAAALSGEIVKLAADLGSFNNIPTAQVIADIQSAMVGNHETMRKYGVVLTETTLKQEAMNQGWIKAGQEMSNAEKIQARLNIITQQTADAQGDMARTSGSFANQMKQLNANIENTKVIIGTALLPMINDLIKDMNAWFKENEDFIKQDLPRYIKMITTEVINLIKVLGNLATLPFDQALALEAVKEGYLSVTEFSQMNREELAKWAAQARKSGKEFSDAMKSALGPNAELIKENTRVLMLLQRVTGITGDVIDKGAYKEVISEYDQIVAKLKEVRERQKEIYLDPTKMGGKEYDYRIVEYRTYLENMLKDYELALGEISRRELEVQVNPISVDKAQKQLQLMDATVKDIGAKLEKLPVPWKDKEAMKYKDYDSAGEFRTAQNERKVQGMKDYYEQMMALDIKYMDLMGRNREARQTELYKSYNEELNKFKQLRIQEFITDQQLALAKKTLQTNLNKELDELNKTSMEKWAEEAKSAATIIEDAYKQVVEELSQGLTDAIEMFILKTGDAEQSFKQFAASFLHQIGRMIVQQSILNMMQSQSGGFSGGGFLSALGGLFGGSSGGSAAANTPYIPAMAAGGMVTKPTLAMVGEAGPEMIVPLNKAGMMGGYTSNITINVNGNSGGGDAFQQEMLGKRIGAAVREQVREEFIIQQKNGGLLDRNYAGGYR